jgi:hypothetical protein
MPLTLRSLKKKKKKKCHFLPKFLFLSIKFSKIRGREGAKIEGIKFKGFDFCRELDLGTSRSSPRNSYLALYMYVLPRSSMFVSANFFFFFAFTLTHLSYFYSHPCSSSEFIVFPRMSNKICLPTLSESNLSYPLLWEMS